MACSACGDRRAWFGGGNGVKAGPDLNGEILVSTATNIAQYRPESDFPARRRCLTPPSWPGHGILAVGGCGSATM